MNHYDYVLVTPDNFEREVLESPVPVLLQFYTKSDDPCADPEVLREFGSRLKIGRVDLDDEDNATIAEFYGVTGAPASMMVRPGGYPVPVEIGNHPVAELSWQVDAALAWQGA
jgi:thioredoxin 1